jgi:hypothetical protein
MISELHLDRPPCWITPERIYRVDVLELNRFMSDLRGRPWEFWRAVGQLPPVSVEYALEENERGPEWLQELCTLGYIPKAGTLIVDQHRLRPYEVLHPKAPRVRVPERPAA